MKLQTLWIGLLLVGCGQTGTHASVADANRDEAIALADVPAHVKQAALDAVPGLVLTEAEREIEKGVTIYSLTGTVNGQRHEVEVTADGQVKEIESQADDDDDDDDEGMDDDQDEDEDEDD
jgi:hypothetical protein